jgi:hypothetical protein
MRKGEKAKIRIKKKHGFGRARRLDVLNFPKGFEENKDGSPNPKREKLMSKAIIYEVELLDFVERTDVEGDGQLIKVTEQKPNKNFRTRPEGIDQVTVALKVW